MTSKEDDDLEQAMLQHFSVLSQPEPVEHNGLPESLTSALMHYGVKGMRWGVRKNESSTPTVKRSPITDTQIRSARAKLGSSQRQINAQIDRTNLATGRQQDREAKKLNEMTMAHLKNPDRATAMRMTSGEKMAAMFLAVAIPGPGTAVAGVKVAQMVTARKNIERQQKNLGVKRFG